LKNVIANMTTNATHLFLLMLNIIAFLREYLLTKK
jgi:hypothetical protein